MRRHTWTAAAALLVAALAVPAGAQPRPLTHVERIYSFDGSGTGLLVVSGTVDPGRGRGLIASVAGDAARTGGPIQNVFFPDVFEMDMAAPHTYGVAGRQDLCADPVTVCTLAADGGLGFTSTFAVSGDDEHEAHVRFAIALRGARVTFKEKMIGWRGAPLHGLRQVTNDDVEGEGVTGGGFTAGALLSASAPAGRRGSIAIGVPPCDDLGAGAVVLAGPSASQSAVCPTGAFAAVASRPGTWTLSGLAAGLSGHSTRLVVLDL
jgi:hypothetical protein